MSDAGVGVGTAASPGETTQGMPSSFSPPKPAPKPKDPEERLKAAETAKEDGNKKFKEGDIKGAKLEYEKVIDLADPKSDRGKAVRLPALLNLALCCLKSEPCEGFRALECCEDALEMEPENPKATYRKGKALIELGELKEAEWELRRACKLSPKDIAVRQDLEKLQKRLRDDKAKEKETCANIFKKGAGGFASEGRESEAAAAGAADRAKGNYEFFKNPDENAYLKLDKPHEEARKLQAAGRFEDAIAGWEAAVCRSASRGEWPQHFQFWLELSRLFMDLNVDALALRCLNKVISGEMPTGFPQAEGAKPLSVTKQHAMLLRSICLLNEAEGDPKAEVTASLEEWINESQGSNGSTLETRLSQWRDGAGIMAGADAAIAHGLLHLISGRDDVIQAFADALAASEYDGSCFGDERRRATRWNMLGAVVANRERHEHALVAYTEALRLQPQYPRALVNRAIALIARGDGKGAAASCALVLSTVPEWAAESTWVLLKKAALETGSPDGLPDAVEQRNLLRVRELTGVAESVQSLEEGKDAEPLEKILARMDLAVDAASAA
eukprot:gnl/TRDRNA2_/TRDRNA2_181912_c0_seq1.p1 gnl/TRDRNA2_/TRDRNA2_181912_c0~~gnl/TRDRNA2_/TRDRNA2_181912_c0_seq1.p1  ORF type:complete len:611 (+),score=157.31 gnl/TRDRNA2_/TRDRNA2_181912_c0_seq1:160-1833(+)